MKKVYIIKTGNTFSNIKKEYGDFEDWILKYINEIDTEIIDVLKDEKLPLIENCKGVIITGSHSMVTEECLWSLEVETFIQNLAKEKIPLLGICYGHQLIAKSLGGEVIFNPKGMELGTVKISLNDDGKKDFLFKNLGKDFYAHVVHSQSVLKLPHNSKVLAFNDFEANHAFKIEPCIWGVQFHPEYDEQIIKAYIKEVLKTKKIEKEKILSQVKEASQSNKIIELFIEFIKNYSNK